MRLWLAIWSMCALVTAAGARDDVRPPNVVLIVIDDLGWGDLSCHGNDFIETPAIDRLAAAGVRFTRAYAASSVCSPSRAALLTGRAPARIGLTDYIRPRVDTSIREGELRSQVSLRELPAAEETLAELLKRAGYATAHVGKWHLGESLPDRHGFDRNVGGASGGRPPDYFDPYCFPGTERGIETLPGRKPGEYLTDREADEGVQFIRSHAQQPFFLHLSHHAVHKPIQAKSDWIAYYSKKAQRARAIEAAAGQDGEPSPGRSPQYAAMIASVDEALGTLVHTLDELDLTRRTLIIVTSDNGALAGKTDAGVLRGGKGSPYENGLRVPLIVSWPGQVREGVESDAVVSLLDLVPTVLASAALPAPGATLDGISLWSHLRSGTELTQRTLAWHYPHYYRGFGPHSVVRRGPWKLVRWYERQEDELYHVERDPLEQVNLAPRSGERARELAAFLERWLKDVEARLPEPFQDG